jgi:hypothetical protein
MFKRNINLITISSVVNCDALAQMTQRTSTVASFNSAMDLNVYPVFHVLSCDLLVLFIIPNRNKKSKIDSDDQAI